MILTVAAFDQFITVLFLDDGVFQLLAPGDRNAAGAPAWPAMLEVLALYDLHDILVDEESLSVRGLGPADVAVHAVPIPACRVAALLREHDRVVVCG